MMKNPVTETMRSNNSMLIIRFDVKGHSVRRHPCLISNTPCLIICIAYISPILKEKTSTNPFATRQNALAIVPALGAHRVVKSEIYALLLCIMHAITVHIMRLEYLKTF